MATSGKISRSCNVRIPITSAANSSLDFGQYEQPFGWAMIGSAGRSGQEVGV